MIKHTRSASYQPNTIFIHYIIKHLRVPGKVPHRKDQKKQYHFTSVLLCVNLSGKFAKPNIHCSVVNCHIFTLMANL